MPYESHGATTQPEDSFLFTRITKRHWAYAFGLHSYDWTEEVGRESGGAIHYYLLVDSPEGIMKESELTGRTPPESKTDGDIR